MILYLNWERKNNKRIFYEGRVFARIYAVPRTESNVILHMPFKVEKIEGKPTAAFVLSLIGGILTIFGGITILSSIGIVGIFSAYGIILGLIITLGSVLMYKNPSSTHMWGIVILILSIISGLNIIALIGGILAIFWKPRRQGPLPPPAPM
jgi:hypothetical protein